MRERERKREGGREEGRKGERVRQLCLIRRLYLTTTSRSKHTRLELVTIIFGLQAILLEKLCGFTKKV